MIPSGVVYNTVIKRPYFDFRELNSDHVCAFGYKDKAGIPFGRQSGDRLT